LAKPAAMAEDPFDKQKKAIGFVFDSVAGIAASYQKDWPGAIDAFMAALALNPEDATTHYRLGAAYLQEDPPQANDGFWELGRSIALKIPGTDQVKQFLRGRLIQYQQPGCDKLVDAQINQVLTLSSTSGERPADFSLPSAQDLLMARDDTTNFLPWLQEGGAHGNTMWLATCGLEFPDVAVRVMEMTPGETPDQMTMKVFRAPTQEEMMAATEPNMEIHIVGQPDARKLHKDDLLRFTGTLGGYQPAPFLLTWDDCRINVDDLSDLTTPVPGGGGGGGRGGAGRGRGGAQ
jgi:TPR repeat